MYNLKVKQCLDLLAEEDKCVVNINTLYRYIRLFEEQNIIPPDGIEGTRRRKPPLVYKKNMTTLNDRVLTNSGKVDTVNDLAVDINTLHRKEKENQGHFVLGGTTGLSRVTLKKYTSQLSDQDGISLVKPSSARPQGARRQMAGTSVRNLVSQVATLLVTSFVEGHYEKPKQKINVDQWRGNEMQWDFSEVV